MLLALFAYIVLLISKRQHALVCADLILRTMMRTLQLLGLILTIAGITLGFMMLAPIGNETSNASLGAAGLGIMFLLLPMLGCSALMLIFSSIALFNHEVRKRTYFRGSFWLTLWKCNLVISAGYTSVVIYVAYLWIKTNMSS